MQACFHAVHDLARAVVPPMVRRKTGNLVFTGARAVGESIPELSLYLAAKSALHAYAGCLAAELAPAGIAVTVVAPGEIDADLDRASTPDPDRSDRVSVEAVVDALLAASLARVGGAGVVSVVEPPAAGDARS
jgi:short-subunit dehydrogenase